MRITIYSTIGFILAGSFFIPQVQALVASNSEYAEYRIIAINIVLVRILIESFFAKKRYDRALATVAENVEAVSAIKELDQKNQVSNKKNLQKIIDLESKLSGAESLANKSSDSLKSAETTATSLVTANRDLKLKNSDLELKLKNNPTAKEGAEALNLLAQLQQKGRFLDFVMDDIATYPDQQIGAAARIVHQGCKSVFQECFDIKPVRENGEGQKVTLDPDYSADEYRLLGKVGDEPPYEGTLLHKGWITDKISLPKFSDAGSMKPRVIFPAEVEIS